MTTPPNTNRHPKRCDMRMNQTGAMMTNASPMRATQSRSSQRGTVKTLIIALIVAALPAILMAQGTLSPVAQQVFLDNNGRPINNAKICTYAAGTSTPQATYSNQALTSQNANPVRTDSSGRPTTGGLYLLPTSYKFLVLTAGTDNTCSTGTTIYSQDNVSAVPATAVGLDVTGTAGEAISAGDVVYLSGADGRWYKADADVTASSSTAGMVGIAPSAVASAASGSFRVGGRITGLSGLTTGALYYASATAGALTSTPPTNQWLVGKADTTTSLLITQNEGGVRLPDSDGTHSLVLTTTSNLTADRLLTLVPGDAARTITLSGNPTLSDWFDQAVKAASSPTFVGLTLSGAIATPTTLTQSGDHIFSANAVTRRSTSDGSDNGSQSLTGGGATGTARGGELFAFGNEAGTPGSLVAAIGNVAASKFAVNRADGTESLNVLGSDGTFTATTSNGGNGWLFNTTHATSGTLAIQRAGSNKILLGFTATDVSLASIAAGVHLNLDAGGGGGAEVRSTTIYGTTAADAANVFVQSDGTLGRSTSSLVFKDWRPLTLTEARAVLHLTPIAYTSRLPIDDPRRLLYGFGAEPSFAVAAPFGVPDQTNYDLRAIVAATNLVQQQHDDRLDRQLDLIAGIETRLRALEAENAELRARLGLSPTHP